MKHKLMTHFIAYYPNEEKSFAAAKGLIDGGAEYLEIQFPFSDPSADGPIIQEACSKALDAGFNLEKGFKLISKIKEYSDIPIFLMSYANIPYTYGIEKFINKAKEIGVYGLIIPDLTFDYDEGLYLKGKNLGIQIVPVIAPSISNERLEKLSKMNPEYIYTALRVGITGKKTKLTEDSKLYLKTLEKTNSKIMAGFGIRAREQVEDLASSVHCLIVGSALVQTITSNKDNNPETVYSVIKKQVEDLCKL